MKIHKGDTVIITSGKDKGRKGKVEAVFPKEQTVLVAEVNIVKRHTKKKNEQDKGGIIEKAKPLSVAKMALICPKCNKQTRVGFVAAKGEKVRVCRKCEQKI